MYWTLEAMCHDKQCLHFFHSKCLSQRTLQVTTNLKLLVECAMQEGQILEAVSHDAQLICSLMPYSEVVGHHQYILNRYRTGDHLDC